MPYIIKAPANGGKEYKLAPEGTHQAICNMIVILGQQEVTWMGKTKVQPQCYIRWELPTERTDEVDGITAPLSVGRIYHESMHEKARLREHLEGWRGRAFTPAELNGFDLFALAGKCCQVRDRKSTRLNSSHSGESRMPSSA